MEISAQDVVKLRKSTGAGMMDCKKALQEANGNFDEAVKLIRERGKALANKRADRVAGEGVSLAKVSADEKKGILIVLNCETDFVAKNADFIKLAEDIAGGALEQSPDNLDALKDLPIAGGKVSDRIADITAAIGEKVDLSFYNKIEGEQVVAYIHPGSKVSSVVAFNQKLDNIQTGKDIAMQIAAMNPVAINKENVPQEIIDRELEIGREQARLEGKAEAMLDKIAQGKLNKFFKENTLLEQQFIKDNKITVQQYLQQADKNLQVKAFLRYSLVD